MVRNKRQNSGFTLIELLVVMSIISFMGSASFAAVQKAKSHGRDARRVSDMRNVLNALALEYSNLGKFPCYGNVWDSSIKMDGSRNQNFMEFLVTDKLIGDNLADPLNNVAHDYSYITFKSTVGGTCGQIIYLGYTTENPISSCVGNGVLFNQNHCHIFFPNPPNCPNWSDAALTGCGSYIDNVKDYVSP